MTQELNIKKFLNTSLKSNNTLIIHKSKLSLLEEKIEKINKKRERLIKRNRISEDTPKFSYSVNKIKDSSYYDAIFSDPEKILINGTALSKNINGKQEVDSDTVKSFVEFSNTFKNNPNEFIHINLENTSIPSLTDWKVIGILSPLEENPELYRLTETTDIELPKKYKKFNEIDPCNCDHCDKSRKRNNTFVILNEKTAETMQVGGDCLKDFVKKQDMNHLLLLQEFDSLFDEFGGERGERYKSVIDKEEYLATVSRAIQLDGEYISQRKANYDGQYTTNEIATYVCDEYLLYEHLNNIKSSLILSKTPQSEIKERLDSIRELVDKYRIRFKEDLDNAKSVIKKYESMNDEQVSNLDSFHFNIYTALANNSDVFIGNSKNIVAYSMQEYLVEKEKIKEQNFKKEEMFDKPIYIANEKDKIEEIELQLKKAKSGYSYYGYEEQLYYSFNFKTIDGRDVFFKTTGELPEFLRDENDYFLDPQDINSKFKDKFFKIKGSIKKNTDFEMDNGDRLKRTTLTRAKFLSEPTENPQKNGQIYLNAKYNINTFNVESIEEKKVKHGENIIPEYKYNLTDKDGNEFLLFSTDKINTKKNDIIEIGYQNGYDNTLIGFSSENVKIVEEHNQEQKTVTKKQLEKHFKGKPKKQTKLK